MPQGSLSVPNFDLIEVARGALASLSFRTDHFAHEVHIGRIQEIFFRAGISQQALLPALRALNDLREAEQLEHGYWLPTPSRRVPLDSETSLLISISPTNELKRHFQSVRRAGLGRLACTQQVMDLPCQFLQSWLGAGDTAIWARIQIESAVSKFRPSIATSDLKVFGVKATKRSNNSLGYEPIWLPSTDRHASEWSDVKLFRSRVSERHHRYFLGQIFRNSKLLEGPAVQDNLRLQYGLAALLGQPLTSSVVSKGNIHYLRLPLSVPRSARRALSALCEMDPNSFGYLWICSQVECWPTVQVVLKDLGCGITNNE